MQATHPESGARFTLVSEQRVEPGFWGGIASGPRQSEVNITRSPISRLPMGFHFAAAHAGSSGRSLDVEMNHEMVRAWVQYPGAHEAFKGDRTRFDGSAANVLLESTARVTFGRVCGVRFAAADDTLLGTQNIRTWRSEHTDTVAYDLAEWAVARGWSVGTPDKVPCVTLTKEGREILLPLAAMQAKVDGQWRDLGDCVAEKEGRWLVPASLDDLVQ